MGRVMTLSLDLEALRLATADGSELEYRFFRVPSRAQ
jgi:hypothetical protein